MACGVPVISSNAGGLPEINIQGKTGFLAEVGDVDTMAADAMTILGSDESLQQFKENALAHAADFSIDKIVPLYESLYEEVAHKKYQTL